MRGSRDWRLGEHWRWEIRQSGPCVQSRWRCVARENGGNLVQVHGSLTKHQARPQRSPCLCVRANESYEMAQTADKFDKKQDHGRWIPTPKKTAGATHSETTMSDWNRGFLPINNYKHRNKSIFFSFSLTLPHVLEEVGHKWKEKGGREFRTKNVIRSFKVVNFNIWNWSKHSKRFPRCH